MRQSRGTWYEECVRVVLAREWNVPVASICSPTLDGATLPGRRRPRHRIDLYKVDEDHISRMDTVIECRWRGKKGKVDQNDVTGFITVRNNAKASKAMIVTNNGFTAGAVAMAESENIALNVISPQGDADVVPVHRDRAIMRAAFEVVVSARGASTYRLDVKLRSIVPPSTTHPTTGAATPSAVPASFHRAIIPVAPAGGGGTNPGPAITTRVISGPSAPSAPAPSAPTGPSFAWRTKG